MSRPGLDSQYEIHGDPNDTRDALEGPPARRLWVSRAIAFVLVAASAYCVFRGFGRYSPTTENIDTLTAFLGSEKKLPTKDELGGLDPKSVLNAWTELTTQRLGAERIHLWSTYAVMALCPVGLLAAVYVWWRGQFIRSQPAVTIDRFQVYPTVVALVLIAAVMGFNVYTQGALGHMPSGASFKTFVQEKQDARNPERFAALRGRFQQAVAKINDVKQKPVARAEAAKGVLAVVSRTDFAKLCPEGEKGPMIATLHELINANYANEMVCPPLIKSIGALGAAAEMAKVSAERERNKSAWIDVKTLSATRYLHAAVTAGNDAAVKQLIRRGIDVNALVPGKGHTALHQAVFQRNLSTAKVLLDARARVDVAGTHGQSPAVKEFPLHRAIGEPQLVKLLLDRGAAANVVDAGGMTPLHRAASAGDLASARLLIQYSAAVNRLDKGGRTPRDIAEKLTAADKKSALRDLLERNGGQSSGQLAAKPGGVATPKAAGKPTSQPTASSTARAASPATQPATPATPKAGAKAPAKQTNIASTPRD
jgi:hypothetical protein